MIEKRELRAIISSDLFIKIDKLRRLYGGVSRTAIVRIAVQQMFDREAKKETAPTQEAA